MGLFKKKNKGLSREELLSQNAGVPFTTEIIDDRDDTLAYVYTDVMCTVTGNMIGLQEGAVLYARENGELANTAYEVIGIIDNKKIAAMVTDMHTKDRFTTCRTKFVRADGAKMFVNIGFWTDDDLLVDTVDEDEEDF